MLALLLFAVVVVRIVAGEFKSLAQGVSSMSSIRSITRIEPGQFALMMGATYALLGIVFAIILFAITAVAVLPTGNPFGGMARGMGIVLFPIIYGVIGYIGGLVGAFVYNLVAGTVGGIKVTVSD